MLHKALHPEKKKSQTTVRKQQKNRSITFHANVSSAKTVSHSAIELAFKSKNIAQDVRVRCSEHSRNGRQVSGRGSRQ